MLWVIINKITPIFQTSSPGIVNHFCVDLEILLDSKMDPQQHASASLWLLLICIYKTATRCKQLLVGFHNTTSVTCTYIHRCYSCDIRGESRYSDNSSINWLADIASKQINISHCVLLISNHNR